MLTQILVKNLDIVFLVYGLAFFCMGVMIFTHRPPEQSSFKIAPTLLLLAIFGIIHGINEWFDMFAIIKGFHSRAWNILTSLILTLSYIFLLEFGRKLAELHIKTRLLNAWVSIIPALIVIPLIFTSSQPQSIWPRYFLGLPAGLLSSFGFISYYDSNKNILKMLNIHKYFILSAVALGVYAIIGGLICPKADFIPASMLNYDTFIETFGLPVQLLRAICAVILSLSIFKILDIFYWENTVELKSALQEITVAKAYVDNIIRSIVDTLIVIDSRAKIRAINKNGCQILGYDETELLGKPITKVFKKGDYLKGKALRKFIKDESLKNFEVTCYAKDNTPIPMIFSGSIMRDLNGKNNGIVGIGKDLREFKQLQAKLIETEKFAAMGKVSSVIGHEFRNQLSIMRNAVYYIKTKLQNKDPKIDKHLEMLDNEIIEVNRTIENILLFAKTKQPEFKVLDLKNLLLEIIEKMPKPDGISVTTEIEENLPKVTADSLQISRVFINVILNALDAMEKEGKLHIILKNIGEFILIQFNDTGKGITADDKKRLFEPFFSSKAKGTGLGLATSKIIVEAHRGNIEIESATDKGTSVAIKLPINYAKKTTSYIP